MKHYLTLYVHILLSNVSEHLVLYIEDLFCLYFIEFIKHVGEEIKRKAFDHFITF